MYDNDYDIVDTNFGTEEYDSDYSNSSEDSSFRFRYDQRYTTPTIPIKVPPLEEISSVAVVIALWNHKNILAKCISTTRPEMSKMTKEWDSFRDEIRQSVKELPVPTSISNYIDTYVFKMEKEICDWVSYHLRKIFFQQKKDHLLYHHIYNLVWHPNGAINYKETARSLLSSVRLSDIEKYRFLCTYCLKDEMEKMPASLFSNNNKDYVCFDEYPLISYWNCYFRNKLNLASITEIVPSNVTMVLHDKVDNWPSKEYFFDLSSSDEQVECAKTLITKSKTKYQKLVLMKLNETQRIHVYLDNAVHIMKNYARSDCNSDDILPTWLEIRDLISEHQFLAIFQKILNLRKDETLKNIWIEAPTDLKRHTMKLNDHELIRRAFHSGRYYKGEFKLDLLFAVLSDADASLKREIINEKYFGDLCEEFLEMGKTEFFDRLLRLCFSKDEEFTNVKQNFVRNSKSVRVQCMYYYEAGYLKQINSYLDSLMSSKSEAILQYKKNILMSETLIAACSRYVLPMEYRNKLREIISDGLPTKDLATEFTKKVISSKHSLSKLRNSIKYDSVDRVQECIDYYLESNEDKRTLKKQIIHDEIFLSHLLRRYDKLQWKNFIQWALEDDQAVENFKTELHVDAIFEQLLKSCIFKKFKRDRLARCTLKRHIKFNSLDLFLKWYFVSSAKINRYKRRRIDSWMDIDSIETLLKLEIENDKYFKAVMKWFFGNNVKQIVKFKNKLFKEGIKY